MPNPGRQSTTPSSPATAERALNRIIAEICDGLRHGHFSFTIDCEITGHERRRLTLRVGKSHQFLIPKEECLRPTESRDSCDGSADDQ